MVSMTRVAECLRVSPATLYNYGISVEDLLVLMVDHLTAGPFVVEDGRESSCPCNVAMSYFDWLAARSTLVDVLVGRPDLVAGWLTRAQSVLADQVAGAPEGREAVAAMVMDQVIGANVGTTATRRQLRQRTERAVRSLVHSERSG